jgi:hypothetical protein
MADSSEHGWKVVQEYTSNPLAEDSDDDKKILRAQTRAERKSKAEKAKKKRPTPYLRPAATFTVSNVKISLVTGSFFLTGGFGRSFC